MYVSTIDPKLLERAQRAELKQSVRQHINALRDSAPILLDAAAMVDTQWFELDARSQKAIVAVRDSIIDQARRAPATRGPFGRLRALFYALRLSAYEPDTLRYAVAASIFAQAVSAALARERAAVARQDVELTSDPAFTRAIAEGRAVNGDGAPVEVEPGDFLRAIG